MASSKKGDEHLETHLRSLYLTRCQQCGREIQAEAFLWRKDEDAPYGRLYECPECGDKGERSASPEDVERALIEALNKARPQGTKGIYLKKVSVSSTIGSSCASALRNMDPSLEEAAEISGASAFATLFSVTFPLIMPAIISGMLLSFIVMLGIYGIPAVLGAPSNINVLTTYIFKLTNWSPPLYNTAAAVAIILMVVTGLLVFVQQKVLGARSYTTVAGKERQFFSDLEGEAGPRR